jgi:hypothetical protein
MHSAKQFIQLDVFGAFTEKLEAAVSLNVARDTIECAPCRKGEAGTDRDTTHSEISGLGKRKADD